MLRIMIFLVLIVSGCAVNKKTVDGNIELSQQEIQTEKEFKEWMEEYTM